MNCFEQSSLSSFTILNSYPFLIYFACYYSYSFMKAIAPLLVQATIFQLNKYDSSRDSVDDCYWNVWDKVRLRWLFQIDWYRDNLLNSSLMSIWSSLLLCPSCSLEKEFVQKLILMVREGTKSQQSRDWIDSVFGTKWMFYFNKQIIYFLYIARIIKLVKQWLNVQFNSFLVVCSLRWSVYNSWYSNLLLWYFDSSFLFVNERSLFACFKEAQLVINN